MNGKVFRNITVGELITELQKIPPHFRIDFSPGEETDISQSFSLDILEGDTSDGPGTAWIRLEPEEDEPQSIHTDLEGPIHSLVNDR